MNHKVILAEDSLTIQKVIKITLANQPFDIVDCSSEEELFHKLAEVQPKIVFLDFNLSSKYTGYELTTKIKSMVPSAKVLLLLGTFDTVDDHAMEKSGASDKIVKPFDSNKFIAICKQLIDTFAGEDNFAAPTASESDTPSFKTDEEDQWTVNHTSGFDFNNAQDSGSVTESAPLNPLVKEISDWGMSIPGVINDKLATSTRMELPPVINEVVSVSPVNKDKVAAPARPEKEKEVVKETVQFPVAEDLDYPDLNFSAQPQKDQASDQAAAASKLISIDTFQSAGFELELEGPVSSPETDVQALQKLIQDEVEDDLWKADEFEDLKNEVSSKLEEVSHFQPSMEAFDESLFKPLDESETVDWHSTEAQSAPYQHNSLPIDNSQQMLTELRSEMEELVKKYVKEYMDQMFQKNVEKVSWEVIPDLAENLIRQELGKISSKILDDN